MDAAQKGGQKGRERIHIEVEKCAGNDDPPKRWYAKNSPYRAGRCLRDFAFARASLRLRNHQQSGYKQDRGSGRDDHSHAPAISLRDRPTEEKSQSAPDRHTEHKQRQNAGALIGRKKVTEPACGGRSTACLTYANSYSRNQEHGVAGRQCSRRCQGAPDDNRKGQESFATARVSNSTKRQSDNGVQPNENAAQQADLRIG